MADIGLLNNASGQCIIHLDKDGSALCGSGGMQLRTNAPEAATCPECLSASGANLTPSNGRRVIDRVGVFPMGDGKKCAFDGREGQTWECRPADVQAYIRCGMHGRVMEVGVQEGKHAHVMVDLLKPSYFVGIDPWLNVDRLVHGEAYSKDNYREAMNYVGYLDGVNLIRGRSQDVMPTLPSDSFDYIYIDGDHYTDACTADIKNALKLVRLYGIVGGHDYGVHPSVIVKKNERDAVHAAIDNVFDGYFVDAMGSDWWVIATPEIKALAHK